jgi:ribulose-phosphate 3-epimerase
MNIKVVPGILEQNFEDIEKKVGLVRPFVDTIQIDLCDGKLVANTSFSDPEPFREIIKDKIFELHAMISEPGEVIDDWVNVGFKRVIAHIEGLTEPMGFLEKVKEKNVSVGLGIDVETKISAIKNYLDFLDFVLVMTVKSGFSGQKFDSQMVDKIRLLREMRPNLDIEVDGGINLETGKQAKEAGANILISTSYIFSGDVKGNIDKLRQI